MDDDRLLEFDVLDLVPSFSWWKNSLKLSLDTVNLLILYWINYWLPPLLLWFHPLVLIRSYPFIPWLAPLAPWFDVTLSLSPGVDIWIFILICLLVSVGVKFLLWPPSLFFVCTHAFFSLVCIIERMSLFYILSMNLFLRGNSYSNQWIWTFWRVVTPALYLTQTLTYFAFIFVLCWE